MNLSFLTIGDDAFFDSIKISVHQGRRFHPQASFYIYDWGLTDSQRAELSETSNVEEIVDWTDRFVDLPVIEEVDWGSIMKEVKKNQPSGSIKDTLKKLVSKYILLKNTHWQSWKEKGQAHQTKEWLLAQKPFCMLDCLRRANGKVVFLDGDAFLTGGISDILSEDFDVGVTLRRMDEIRDGRNNCQVLNSGVIFFNGSPSDNQAFVEAWIEQMKNTREYLIEQTSLTRLINRSNPQIFKNYFNRGVVSQQGTDIQILTLPCDKYNFNWIEEGINSEVTKIVHFKGGRHSDGRFQNLLQDLEISLSE